MNYLEKLQQALDQVIEEEGFLGGCLISQEGLIILSSQQMGLNIEVKDFAAKVASIIDRISVGFDVPSALLLSYSNTQIIIQSVPHRNPLENSMFLAVIIPRGLRFYKNKLKRIIRHLPQLNE